MYQAVFHKYGEHIHVPVKADSEHEAFGVAKRDNPMLVSWALTIKPLGENEQAKDDRAELKFVESKPGRPVERKGQYQRLTLEMRADLVAEMDAEIARQKSSRRAFIEELVKQALRSEE